MKNRLRFLYQRGDMYYLETLLDSDSFGDFLTRLDLVRKLIRADQKLLDSHREDQKQVEAEKASIERDLEERRRLAEEAGQLHKRLVKSTSSMKSSWSTWKSSRSTWRRSTSGSSGKSAG